MKATGTCSHCDAPATTVGGRLAVPMCNFHAGIANDDAAREDQERDAIAEAAERRAEARRVL